MSNKINTMSCTVPNMTLPVAFLQANSDDESGTTPDQEQEEKERNRNAKQP